MMQTAWRIVQAGRARDAFSGEGARRYPGRWNDAGTPMVYTAESLSLAALEMLVHLGAPELLARYVCIPIRFDDALCVRPAIGDIPRNWTDNPPPASTRRFGSAWAADASSAVLAVPSVVIPTETVFLLNPLHPDFSKIRMGGTKDFSFDSRLRAK
jgi:RES domain-containing protein